jgi:hypothetical protein
MLSSGEHDKCVDNILSDMKTNTLKTLLLLILIAFSINKVTGQWQQTNGPAGGYIGCFAISGSNIFAGTAYAGVFLSTNNGNSWIAVDNGFPVTENVTAIAINGTSIFAGTLQDGIFRSTNNGSSWTPVNNGLGLLYGNINALVVSGGYLLASSSWYGLFRSSDNGNNWVSISNIAPDAFAVSGTNIFGAEGNGVVLSTDNGLTWVSVNNGLPPNSDVSSLAISGNNIFAGIWQGGVYRSSNNGNSWVPCNSGLPDLKVTELAAIGTNIFAGTYQNGMCYSANNGSSWVVVNNGFPSIVDVSALAVDGNNVYSGFWGLGVYLSSDNGTNWTQKNNGLIDVLCGPFALGDTVFACTQAEGILISNDIGNSWTPINNGLVSTNITAMGVNGSNLYACTDNGIYLSMTHGSSWSKIGAGYNLVWSNTILFSGNNIFVTPLMDGVYASTDNGTTWTVMNNGLPLGLYVDAMIKSGNNILAGSGWHGLYLSQDNANSWTKVIAGMPSSDIYSFGICNNNVFASTSGGVYKSADNGISWTPANNGLGNNNVISFAVSGNILFASAQSAGVFVSYNDGANWTAMNDGLLGNTTAGISIAGNTVFAGAYGKGIWKFPSCSPIITGADSLCVNSGFYNYATEAGMNNYTWTVSPGGTITSGQGTNVVQVIWNSPGQKWITVNYGSTHCAELTPTQFNITVQPLPGQAGTISGPDTVCAGDHNVVYSTPMITGTDYYVWTLPAGATIISGAGTNHISVDFANDASSGNVTVYGNNLCGNGIISSSALTVNPVPLDPVITLIGFTLYSNAPEGNQWYLDGIPIPGATLSTLIATQTGHYWDVVTLYNCMSDTSNHVFILLEGFGNSSEHQFNVFPNPTNNKITISTDNKFQNEYNVDIYTVAGDLVMSTKFNRDRFEFDISTLKKGIYMMKIRTGNDTFNKKLIIQ